MQFRLLGPLEVTDGTKPLALGGRKPRALLARLLLDAGRTVSVDRLVDDLWGDDVPDSAVKMVQILVSQLRKVLPPGVLSTRAPGYLVELDDDDALDLSRFNRIRAEGRAALEAGDAAAAARLLTDALELWRGPALAEFSEPFARVEGAHLEELRLGCLEERIDADLAAGRHADVAGELDALAAQHPLRERLHRQLIVALYRAGRQAEALAAYERFRRTLDDELGIEPSSALKALQLAILNQDPSLEARPEPAVEEPERRGIESAGLFGRADELARLETALDAAAEGSGSTILIEGRAGIGKSSLLAELARRGRSRGATVLDGRCIQLVGAGLPYLPFADALRQAAGSPSLAALAGRLRELHSSYRSSPTSRRPNTPATGRTRGSGSSRRCCWCSTSSAARARSCWRSRTCTGRTHPRSTCSPSWPTARRGREHCSLGRIGPRRLAPARRSTGSPRASLPRALRPHSCSTRSTREAVEGLVRSASDAAPSDALVEKIFKRSEGNPLFAHQLLTASLRGDATLPPALRDMLLADVGRLPEESRWVLRVTAAM